MVENIKFSSSYLCFYFFIDFCHAFKIYCLKSHLKLTFGPPPCPQQGEDGAFGKELQLGSMSSFTWCWQLRNSGFLPSLEHCACKLPLLDQSQKAFLNVVFSLGPSMVVRIALVLILSTSFVIQMNAQSTLKTSEHSSASSVTPTLNSRTPNTTGCPMNILTVSRSLPFPRCVDGYLEFMLCLHQSLGLLIPLW